jgi:hypothetical protein
MQTKYLASTCIINRIRHICALNENVHNALLLQQLATRSKAAILQKKFEQSVITLKYYLLPVIVSYVRLLFMFGINMSITNNSYNSFG